MGKGILVTGGARSGKSNYAETLAKELGEKVLYIATSIPFDDEMRLRVEKHRERRPGNWITYEDYRNLWTVPFHDFDGVLLDCITVMITNLMFDIPEMRSENYENVDFNTVEAGIMKEIKALIEAVKSSGKTVILVSNEIGFGIVPETKLGREFRDIAGRVNQYIASQCEEVYLTVCGIPMRIK